MDIHQPAHLTGQLKQERWLVIAELPAFGCSDLGLIVLGPECQSLDLLAELDVNKQCRFCLLARLSKRSTGRGLCQEMNSSLEHN
jgi:hypothetical protein